MMDVLRVVGVTLGSWLLHLASVAIYMPHTPHPKTLVFRSLHAIEIAVNILLIFGLYFLKLDGSLAPWAVAAIALITLMVVDGAIYLLWPKSWQHFDGWHVATAYSLIAITILLLGYLAARR